MKRGQILDTAKSHITKDRQATHGKPENSFALIAALWSADLGIPLTAVDVCRLMVLFKMARAKINPTHMDNWIDGSGYCGCAGELADPTDDGGVQSTESNEGWIKWDGKSNKSPVSEPIIYRLRSGRIARSDWPEGLIWSWEKCMGAEIVAYRPTTSN